MSAAPIYDAIATHKVTHLCGAPIVMSTCSPRRNKNEAPGASRRVRYRRSAAAGGGAGGDGGGRLQRHACLRADRTYGPASVNDWHRDGSSSGPEQAAKKARQGVRYPVLEALDVIDPETRRRCRATVRRWAK